MKRVAVTGLGVIAPVGNDVRTFWENIKNGVCGINFIETFDTTDFKVKIAAQVKGFAPENYIEKAQIRKLDLYAQYALAAASMAVEDGGIIGNVESERFGVYVGSGIGGMNTFISEAKKLFDFGPKKVSPFFIPMMIGNIASGSIAIRYNAQGPCLPVVSACATATNAIGEAYRAIQSGTADAIIAGGAEATVNELAMAGFSNMMALSTKNSPTESSMPFDKRRDGFVLGEGAGIILLEELEHAKKRGAKIYCEVSGYGNTCDANHITAPHPDGLGAANAITLTVRESGIEPSSKVYFNAHGTSTPLNDKTETLAIKKAFGDGVSNVFVSSTKSMTGHCLGAAGGIEAVVSILAMNEGVIPPTIGYRERDEECDLDYTPNVKKEASVDYTLSASFGFGGHNAVIGFKKAE